MTSPDPRPALEDELDELLGKVRSGNVPAKDRRRVFRRIRELQQGIAVAGGRTRAEPPRSVAAPERSPRWWWVDPGRGAPSLATLLTALVMGILLILVVARHFGHLGMGSSHRPAVQHQDPLPPRH